MTQNTNYTDDNIRTLEGVQHVRMRPGMYIGRLGNGNNPGDGIYVLLKEIIDNSVDEFAMGHGKQITVDISEDNHVTVRDYGRERRRHQGCQRSFRVILRLFLS